MAINTIDQMLDLCQAIETLHAEFTRIRDRLLQLYTFKRMKRLPWGQADQWRHSKELIYGSVGVDPREIEASLVREALFSLGGIPQHSQGLDYFACLTPKKPAPINWSTYS